MATIKPINTKKSETTTASLRRLIDYVTQETKTTADLMSGINCSPDTVYEQMMVTKNVFGKTGGRQYMHFEQSYHKDENITPEQAHENALKLAKEIPAFDGFEIFVVTHIDKNHIHSHLIVNSVNTQDGHKLHFSKRDLLDMRERNDAINCKQGLHVPQKGHDFYGNKRDETTANNKNTYQLLKKAENEQADSYIQNIAVIVSKYKDIARSREEFIELLAKKDIEINWSDTRKYITFTDLQRQRAGFAKCKVRNKKLEDYYNISLGKEALENGFERNSKAAEIRAAQRRSCSGFTTNRKGGTRGVR